MYKRKFDWKMAKMANFQALPTFPLFPKLHYYTNRYTVIIALQKMAIFVGPKKLEISVQQPKFSPAFQKVENPVQQNEKFEKLI